MSSVLNRKKKQIPAYEYTKKELAELQDLARREKQTEQMLVESHKNITLIAYQVLHDKFGFGQKRIIKAEQMINGYLEAYAEEEISTEQLQVFMKEKCGIDVKQEANIVPYRERFFLVRQKIAPASMKAAATYLVASISNYFALLGVCLKSGFGFSAKKIREVYEWIRYYINTLSRQKEFKLTIRDIAECLLRECRYCDSRFV